MGVLNNLQKRNNLLKSILRHDQLKHGVYSFKKYNKELMLVLNAYKTHKSIVKAASSVGVDKYAVLDCFIKGSNGNPEFRPFYLAINKINGFENHAYEDITSQVEEMEKSYEINKLEDSWVYTTLLDGEKVSIISGDLDSLRQKVKDKSLPLV